MSSAINKTLRSVVFVSCLLMFMLISWLGAKPSVGAPLLQSAQTPIVYLPVVLNGQLSTLIAPTPIPPSVNAGIDQTVTLPNSANLHGVVTDDGLPNPPGHVSTIWSKVSGPGEVTFGEPNVVDTTATFSLNGKYVLQLTANDGATTIFDQVNIVVNQAPTVNAGVDQTIVLPNSVQLNGVVGDDGLPDPPAQLTLLWSKLSGPGTVIFANANNENTTATFSATGDYTLQLTADDGAKSSSDQVKITVMVNQPPIVDAGANQTITWPDSVQLNGTASDDGLPKSPGKLDLLWNKLSGSGIVTFTNASAEATKVTFSKVGIYVLQLAANDGALTTSDQVTITVKSLDGLWQGISTQNNLIAFEIRDHGFVSFTTSYQIGGCGGATTLTSTMPINGSSFTINQSGPNGALIRTTGTFNSATTASGQITVTGSSCGNSVATWTAKNQGPRPTIAYSTADATVLEGAPGVNAGQYASMLVGYEHCYNNKITRSLMNFNLEKIPPGATIARAQLHLYLYGSCDLANRTHTVSAYPVSGTWNENTVTWNSQPEIGQAYGSGSIQSRTYEWYSLDVTDLVKQWASGALPNYGLMLRGPESPGNDSAMLEFLTHEAPTGYQPYLEITYEDGVQASSTPISTGTPFTEGIAQIKSVLGGDATPSGASFGFEHEIESHSKKR